MINEGKHSIINAERNSFGKSTAKISNTEKIINFHKIERGRSSIYQRLAYLNLVSFMIEVIILGILIWSKSEGNIFNLEKFKSPLALNNKLKDAAWVTVFSLKAIFAYLPLINEQKDFEEIVIDKIRFSF